MFTTFGYDSLTLFANLGIMVIYLVFLIVAIIFTKVLNLIAHKSKGIKKLHDRLHKEIYYNCFIRSAIEMYLKSAICVFIALQNTDIVEKGWKGLINTTFLLLLLVGVIVFPIFIYYFLHKNKNALDDDDFKT